METNQEIDKKKNENIFIIPECCVAGWEDCVHVGKPHEKQEVNPAL